MQYGSCDLKLIQVVWMCIYYKSMYFVDGYGLEVIQISDELAHKLFIGIISFI